jgi:hypothetical protein
MQNLFNCEQIDEEEASTGEMLVPIVDTTTDLMLHDVGSKLCLSPFVWHTILHMPGVQSVVYQVCFACWEYDRHIDSPDQFTPSYMKFQR